MKNTEAVNLALLVLKWWQDAQYWDYNGRNVFDDDEDFVVAAKAVLKKYNVTASSNMKAIEAL